METEKTIRIVIADDHPILREGLRKLLEAEPDLRVIGEAGDGVEAVKAVRRLKPDLLLLDLAMPRQTGLEALREIGTLASTATRTVVLAAGLYPLTSGWGTVGTAWAALISVVIPLAVLLPLYRKASQLSR